MPPRLPMIDSAAAWPDAGIWSLLVISGMRGTAFLPCGLADSAGQQFLDGLVDKGGVFRVQRRVSGAVTPDRRDRAQLGARHARDLAPAVLDGEIEVGLARHHHRVGGDRA